MIEHVAQIPPALAVDPILLHHYLHTRPHNRFAYGGFCANKIVAVVTFGTPASRHLQLSACRTAPDRVIELNRLWVCDSMPHNSESWFLAKALKALPPFIVVSYADTAHGHLGYVYRAANFRYYGWTDMERKTPRFDYVTPGKHSRDAFRNGDGLHSDRVRRRPKVRYWAVTGNRRERSALLKIVSWPSLSWKDLPPPAAFGYAKQENATNG